MFRQGFHSVTLHPLITWSTLSVCVCGLLAFTNGPPTQSSHKKPLLSLLLASSFFIISFLLTKLIKRQLPLSIYSNTAPHPSTHTHTHPPTQLPPNPQPNGSVGRQGALTTFCMNIKCGICVAGLKLEITSLTNQLWRFHIAGFVCE